MTSTELAISEPRSALVETKAAKPPRIPKNIVRACELLATGECKTVTAAAARVGVTREWLSRLLQRSHVRVFLQRKSRETIATGALRASHRIIELMEASSEHVSLDASKHVLAIEGIKPQSDGAQVTVNVNVQAGYVLDLRDSADIGHVKTIDAKPLNTQPSDGGKP